MILEKTFPNTHTENFEHGGNGFHFLEKFEPENNQTVKITAKDQTLHAPPELALSEDTQFIVGYTTGIISGNSSQEKIYQHYRREQVKEIAALSKRQPPKGQIEVVEVCASDSSEFVTIARPEQFILYADINPDHPEKTILYVPDGIEPGKTTPSYSLTKSDETPEEYRYANRHMLAIMQPNVKYFLQNNRIQVRETPQEVKNNPGYQAISIENLFKLARKNEFPIDAQLLATAYKLQIQLENELRDTLLKKGNENIKPRPSAHESILETFVPNSTIGFLKNNPWFEVEKNPDGTHIVKVKDNEVLLCLFEIEDDEIYITLNVEACPAQANQLNVVCTGGGVPENMSVKQKMRDESEEELGQSVDPNAVVEVAQLKATPMVSGMSHVGLALAPTAMTAEQRAAAANRADEQNAVGKLRIPLSKFEELFCEGYVTDARVGAAVGTCVDFLREHSLLPLKYAREFEPLDYQKDIEYLDRHLKNRRNFPHLEEELLEAPPQPDSLPELPIIKSETGPEIIPVEINASLDSLVNMLGKSLEENEMYRGPHNRFMYTVGGAVHLPKEEAETLGHIFAEAYSIVFKGKNVFAMDGATEQGVMKANDEGIQHAKEVAENITFVGVGIDGLTYNDVEGSGDSKEGTLNGEPIEIFRTGENHSVIFAVKGVKFGDEHSVQMKLAKKFSEGVPGLVIEADGGGISLNELVGLIEQGLPVIILGGIGDKTRLSGAIDHVIKAFYKGTSLEVMRKWTGEEFKMVEKFVAKIKDEATLQKWMSQFTVVDVSIAQISTPEQISSVATRLADAMKTIYDSHPE